MNPTVSIMTIGDELLIGQVVDTNSAWIGQKMVAQGYRIVQKRAVADQREEIITTLDQLLSVSDIVLITGGIGPTKDDITKQTLADYFNAPLVFDHSVEAHITELLAHRNRSINELTRAQAFVPFGATILPNKIGTAPLMIFEQNRKTIASMPGVPIEMRLAIDEQILPFLNNKYTDRPKINIRTFLVSDYPESALALHIAEWEEALPSNFSLAYLPSFTYVRLRLTEFTDTGNPVSKMDETVGRLYELLSCHIIEVGNENLAQKIAAILKERKLTLSTVESCSGGLIAHQITQIPGISEVFKGTVVAYSNEVKEQIVGVAPKTIEQFGAVSAECVHELLDGAQRLFATDATIAVSGIAGPTGGSPDKPVGTVWIGVQCKKKREVRRFIFGTNREQNIQRTAENAWLILLSLLIE